MTTARLKYTMDNFPFDKLRVGSMKEKTARISDYKDVHQSTFIEEDGAMRNYTIEFPELVSTSISYYIEKDGKNLLYPGLYLNPELHHLWSTKDKQGNPTKSPNGLKIEKFFEDFVIALQRELRLLNETERGQIMGSRFMKLNEHTELIADIAKHPLYDKKHQTKAGLPNETKSKTIPMVLWTQDETKKKQNNNTNDKKKYANVFSSLNNNAQVDTSGEQAVKKLKVHEGSMVARYRQQQQQQQEQSAKEGSDVLKVPDTNLQIYTKIFDLTPEYMRILKKIKASNNKRKRSDLDDENEEVMEKLTDYRDVRRFIYSAQGHPNGTSNRAEMLSIPTVLGPSLHWEPQANGGGVPATIRFTIDELIVLRCTEKRFQQGLSVDRFKALQAKSEMYDKTYGFEKVESDEEEQYEQYEPAVEEGGEEGQQGDVNQDDEEAMREKQEIARSLQEQRNRMMSFQPQNNYDDQYNGHLFGDEDNM